MRAAQILVVVALAACRGGRSRGEAAKEAATSRTSAFPLTVIDGLGREVTIASEPRRIVALVPSHTEVLFALGVGDRVVGVDDSSDYPPEARALPHLGGMYDAHVEQILALKPDLVVAFDSGAAPEKLARLGATVWADSAKKLDDVYSLVEALGALVGRREAAVALAARMRSDVDAATLELAKSPRVRVYYELDPTPYAVGPGSFLGALVAKAGGDNVLPRELGDFPRVSPELVLAKDPEVVLGVALDDAKKRPGWSSLAAVRSGRVFVLSPEEQSLVVRPGPRIADSLRVLAKRLHETPAR